MILALLATAAAGSLDALPSLVGPGEGQGPTHALPAGDLDGDGRGDLVVAVPSDDTNGNEAGAIYVVLDVASLEPFTPLTEVGVGLWGEQPQDRAGFSVAALGDTDGDGLGDVAVGAPEADTEQPTAGKVYVVSGTELAQGSLGAHPSLRGQSRWGRVGARVFGPGDVDGDGRADLLLGAPYPTPGGATGVGWLGLVLAPARGWAPAMAVDLEVSGAGARPSNLDAAWFVFDDDTLFGRAATVVPDHDGDGLPDLLVGAPGLGGHDHAPAPPADTGHGGSGAHTVGAAFLFSLPDDPELMGVSEESAALLSVSGQDLEALPWLLLTLSDGQVLMTAPEAASAYVFETLSAGTSADAPVQLLGQLGDLTGWGAGEGPGGLWLSEPGWDGGRGRILGLASLSSGAVEDGAQVLEGCADDAQAGFGLAGHPGPDPFGQDRPWLGVAAPLASTLADEDGLAYVLTAEHLDAALAADCAGGDGGPEDLDGDGVPAALDCDDAVAWRFPGAPEVCGDGADDDCDGAVDEACAPPVEGCGCAAGGLVGAPWLLALLLLVRRRTP
ncbi:MAG: FG-GAP repeat protein [Alphaproteobacteria bacterium]|nr:FG-GAP repeat protein [Alphaproteobacteria bacterium]